MVYAPHPDGGGWCLVFADIRVQALEFQFLRHKRGIQISNLSILWDRINILCPSNNEDRRNSASVSEHSGCRNQMFSDQGYACQCNNGYQGNPYIYGGCTNDEVKENFSHRCGNITVPFPLARLTRVKRFVSRFTGKLCLFQLNCSDLAHTVLRYNDQLHVTYIDVSEGLVTYIDECQRSPGICRGVVCHNTIGNFTCTECPRNTIYDIGANQCTPASKKNFMYLIGLSSGLGILLLGLSAVVLIRRWKRNSQKKLRRKYFRKNQGLLLEQLISSDENASEKTKIFSLEELEKATDNFDTTRILGHGGHGTVYKGILSDQHVVAIKKSKLTKDAEINDFINEVAILSQINHRNIVKLFGCCLESEVPLLVYDLIPNGSLFETLHADSSSSGSSLPWNDCLRIATEAAGALYYLHSAASVSIFHRDVKSSNILLDGNYTAKVSDFGASRSAPIDQTHVSTNVQGTFGYLDPEYYQTGKLIEKSDVYSFGVVLLELLLRKQTVFTNESGMKHNLCNYFLSGIKTKSVTEITAAEVLEEATVEQIEKVASLAEMCLRLRGDERPTMKQVEMTLQLLLAESMNSSHVHTGNVKNIQPLLTRRVDRGNVAPQGSYNFFSLEREFLSSASLPR
ncbi:hypothetical protein SORBI_3010G025600 [Sorghum bicolor]|uniref:Protein kinase domain-containing protein n=1 Tax=Sorghum bicolor TaxID=4558 RepID=A0A194YGW9_SORBI|nr:hypothetical protein SORBI_3010G025600 [Sorghum bicolor]